MNFILFDDARRNYFLPLTFLRPIADIRMGILTIREKWEMMLGAKTSTLTEEYLNVKYPLIKEDENILINGAVCPTADLIAQIKSLKPLQALVHNDTIVAMHLVEEQVGKLDEIDLSNANIQEIETTGDFVEIFYLWDIFHRNSEALLQDFKLVTNGRKSASLSPTNTVIGSKENVFVEEGANIECAIFNAAKGPIYIGRNVEIMEGALIRGPFSIGDNSVVRMGAKIYGATTIGPKCKVGGELNNVVIMGRSNKVHDGYLGNSVIAEWCNIGADTNCSNMKNTYHSIRVWSYPEKTFIDTGLTLCGLIMGDHSKCGINTMFTTGTVIGISTNIFGSGFMRNFIASFAWGGASGFSTYDLKRAIDVARESYGRRGEVWTEADESIFTHVFETTFDFRKI
ncbi:MAG: GlmU family protein [Bacteroidota bacterium]|nr:GlmU family protein [Bacteroidota bacterium]